MSDLTDISGLEFTVSSKQSTGEGGIDIKEDEFYPAILTEINIFDNPNPAWGKQLKWFCELQGGQFTWKNSEGKTGQWKTSLNTSLICSPKSKLYQIYAKLTGKEPVEGEKINLKQLVGLPVYVMIKIKKNIKEGVEKTYYNIEKIKLREVSSSQPQQLINNNTLEKTPTQQANTSQKIQEQPKIEPLKQQQSEPVSDIFNDVF